MTAEEERLYRRLGEMAMQGDVLLKSGVSPASLKQQWIDSGIEPDLAGQLVTMSQNFGQLQKKRSRRGIAALVLAPVLLIGGIIGVVKLVQAVQGPSGYDVARPIATAACGNGTLRIAETGGRVVLTVGDGIKLPGSLRTYDDGFNDLFFDDDEIVPEHVLCADVDFTASITCDGYYSQEVIDAVESSATMEEARRKLYALGSEGSVLAFELQGNGRTVKVEGSTLTVKLVEMNTYQEIDSTTIVVPPECPETHRTNSYTFESTERTYPTEQHRAQALRDLGVAG